jgi:hypothetical protein
MNRLQKALIKSLLRNHQQKVSETKDLPRTIFHIQIFENLVFGETT